MAGQLRENVLKKIGKNRQKTENHLPQNMEKVKKPGFRLIGLQLEKKTTNSGGQSSIDCGNLWQKFERGKFAEQIPDKMSNEIYAVYFEYEGNHAKPFAYFIGCQVKQDAETPAGMSSLTIPTQNYNKVVAKGKMPACISKAWQDIWNSDIERAYSYDFEVYDELSHDWSNAEVDIFVASK